MIMDYYEELGVDRRASSGEIRQAYRHLVRLLHPDHCNTGPERRLAELQVKRLNGIVAILSDPADREKYDRTLDTHVPVRRRPKPPAWRKSPAVWIGAATLGCIVLVCLSGHTPKPIPPATVQVAEPPPAAGQQPSRSLDRRPMLIRPAPSGPPMSRLAAESESTGREAREPAAAFAGRVLARSQEPPPVLATPEISVPAMPPVEPVRAPVRPTLAGDWLFVPMPGKARAGLYAPEYIELRVTENAGRLRGRYRARYHVADQAISPTVDFQFEGAAPAEGSELPWEGEGGSRGTVKLRLLTNTALEVTWVADRLGTELGLISGAATLVRRAE